MKAAALSARHRRLLDWYRENRRDLPWRKNKDPYRIWLSEVMLQQTTVVAVIPYYERFLERFPTVRDLAEAPIEDVLEMWSGLGYYSRARNLHKAAQALNEHGFPKTADELIEFPGFGPYTSRAVASIAFGDKVGVLDGNVIRVLSRLTADEGEWWGKEGRTRLQDLSDRFAQEGHPDEINQALMELGATVCTPQKTACLLCPWASLCEAREQDKVLELPLKKKRREMEIWSWTVKIHRNKRGQVALTKQHDLPFLKGHWVFPSEARREKKKPTKFDVRGGVTHHDIFIHVQSAKGAPPKGSEWYDPKDIARVSPSKMLQRILETGNE